MMKAANAKSDNALIVSNINMPYSETMKTTKSLVYIPPYDPKKKWNSRLSLTLLGTKNIDWWVWILLLNITFFTIT